MSGGLETPAPLRSAYAPPGPAYFHIEWNAENQLTRVTKDSVEVASFRYDPLGRRISKVAGGRAYSYGYDGTDV
jgi:YD repeat-containing protein